MNYAENDLTANGFSIPWGHTRSYANLLTDNGIGSNGNSWLVQQFKTLATDPDGSNDICLVGSGVSSPWFSAPVSGVAESLFGGYDTLTHSAGEQQFTLTTKNGVAALYHDMTVGENRMAGKLKAMVDNFGQQVVPSYDTSGRMTEFAQAANDQSSVFAYAYYGSGAGSGQLASATVAVNEQQVRQAQYGYYGAEVGGSPGDLKSVTVAQYDPAGGVWSAIEQKHYRYYTASEDGGFPHGLKYVIRGAAYQRMVDAGLDPETAPETVLAQYANYYFAYDDQRRVVAESLDGGRRSYTFSYEVNPDDPPFEAVNTWAMRTIETLPDGNENRVYTNQAGQVLLKILHETSTGNEWYTYQQFDDDYNLVLTANSAAVASVSEPVLPDTTLVVNLKAADGLITEQVYYTTTDPDSGAVAGRLEKVTVKQGSDGSPVTLRTVEYDTVAAFGQSIYPVRAKEVYPNVDGSNPARTTYSYTWYQDSGGNPTFQVQQKITTLPVVSVDQNGPSPSVAGVWRAIFDMSGRLNWLMNPRGAITYQAYDQATGAMIQRIQDVDTTQMSNVPNGWKTVTGWGTHLITDYVNDSMGRTLQALGPWNDIQLREADTTATSVRRVEFTAYLDSAHEVRRASGYMTGDGATADFRIVGAVSLTRTDESGRVTDQIESVRCCNCGPLSTGESFPQEKWSRWTQSIYDTWGRLYASRLYYRIPVEGEGNADANYLETIYGYDVMDRQNRVIEPSGTIRRMVYEARGLVVSNWTGTNDAGATDANPAGSGGLGNNMVEVSTLEYDNGVAGLDGNLTQLTLHVDDSSSNDRVTEYAYDFRDQRISTTANDGTTTLIATVTYDNLGRAVQNTSYQGSVGNSNRIAQSSTYYDQRGRIYCQEVDGVNISDGSITNTVAAQSWYDEGKNPIKQSATGSTSFVKSVYDALDRAVVAYTACVPGTAGVPSGDDNDVADDTVLEQSETGYDRAGNVIMNTRRQRFDDAVGTGPLQNVSTDPKARVSYTALWFDGIGRLRNTADYGTNGGAALVRSSVAPQRSDTVLVTTNRYKDDGEANAVIDPMGFETRWDNDHAGRRIKLVENFISGGAENSRISEYGWHASGQLERLALRNSVTGDQVTTWVYGTTLYDSAVADNNVLRAKIYPESDDRPRPLDAGPDGLYARLEYTVNRQGQNVTFTDADQTLHTYSYDKLGRPISDAVTLPADSPLDNSVLRIEQAYEVRGMVNKVTSYDVATGGSIVNQTALVYDAFANLVQDQQSHSGAVVSGTTPQVTYGYTDGSNNTIRPNTLTYPGGQVLNVQYGDPNSVDDHFNRVVSLQKAGESTTLVDYSYVGVGWQVRVGYAPPAVELNYKTQVGKPVGDSGDPYGGYDRFGRTVDLRWQKTTAGNAQLERLLYGFDRDSRRTWRQRPLTTGEDYYYNYDGLSQLTNAALGNLNQNYTAIGAVPAQAEAWDYDPTGNWSGYQTNANGAIVLDQQRVHDKGNRLTQVIGEPASILLDRVGRMLQVPPGADGDWENYQQITWDAWSRVTQIQNGADGTVLGSYAYDGLSRRITRDANGVTQHCYYSSNWKPLEERNDDQTTPAIQYFWGARHRDDLARRDRATISGGSLDETRYVLMDYFSPAAIIDETGAVTERYRFSAFGIRTILDPSTWAPIATSECAFEYAFQGQFLDTESGFMNFGYRYYSPALGRWLSKDPIKEDGGMNLYAFVKNSGTNAVDHLGLANIDESFSATGGINDAPLNSLEKDTGNIAAGVTDCQIDVKAECECTNTNDSDDNSDTWQLKTLHVTVTATKSYSSPSRWQKKFNGNPKAYPRALQSMKWAEGQHADICKAWFDGVLPGIVRSYSIKYETNTFNSESFCKQIHSLNETILSNQLQNSWSQYKAQNDQYDQRGQHNVDPQTGRPFTMKMYR